MFNVLYFKLFGTTVTLLHLMLNIEPTSNLIFDFTRIILYYIILCIEREYEREGRACLSLNQQHR